MLVWYCNIKCLFAVLFTATILFVFCIVIVLCSTGVHVDYEKYGSAN